MIELYRNGEYHVRNERFGNAKSSGFAVYKDTGTCCVRVACIGFSGEEGMERAKKECDRRALG